MVDDVEELFEGEPPRGVEGDGDRMGRQESASSRKIDRLVLKNLAPISSQEVRGRVGVDAVSPRIGVENVGNRHLGPARGL